MLNLIRRFRGLVLVVGAVALSTTVAFAGEPAASSASGLSKAASHAGKTVPVQTAGDEQDAEDTDVTETEDAGTNDNCSTDPTGLTDEELAALTHGSVVCWAAHQDTPEGYANHGAWVKSWATKNHGSDASTKGNSHKPTDLPSH